MLSHIYAHPRLASPRRHELLLAAGLPHVVRSSSTPETRLPNEPVEAYVQHVAIEKAQAISHEPEDIVLAADTVVALDGEVFGKPIDDADALRMLRALSGRDHAVYTGICLIKVNASSRTLPPPKFPSLC